MYILNSQQIQELKEEIKYLENPARAQAGEMKVFTFALPFGIVIEEEMLYSIKYLTARALRQLEMKD